MLTKKQKAMLEWIKAFKADKGYSPTVKEIAEGLKVYPNAANAMLAILEDKSVIERTPLVARSIVIINEGGR